MNDAASPTRPTAAALAQRLGRSPRTVRRWLARPDFPPIGAALTDDDVEAVRRWRTAQTRIGRRRLTSPGQPSPRRVQNAPAARGPVPPGATDDEAGIVAANRMLKEVALQRAQLDLGVVQGLYERREERDRREAQNKVQVRKALREIARRIAPVAEGQPAAKIRQLIEAAIDGALAYWTRPAAEHHPEPGANGATHNGAEQ